MLFIFLLFTVLPSILAEVCYKNSRRKICSIWWNLWGRENAQKLLVYVLALIIIFFHLVYSHVFAGDYGIMISTVIIFVLLSTRRSIAILKWLRRDIRKFGLVALTIIVLLFIPHMLSTAVSLFFILEAAGFMPSEKIDKNYYDNETMRLSRLYEGILSEKNYSEGDSVDEEIKKMDIKFTEDYFN